jgi:hypothetical protein
MLCNREVDTQYRRQVNQGVVVRAVRNMLNERLTRIEFFVLCTCGRFVSRFLKHHESEKKSR